MLHLPADGQPSALAFSKNALAQKACSLEGRRKQHLLVVCVCGIQSREQDVGIPKLGEILDSHGVQLSPKVIALMLHHPGVKTFGFPIHRITVGIKPRVPNARSARHLASQPRNRQATLPIILLLNSQRSDHWIDQGRHRHQWPIRVTRIGVL